MVFSLLFSTYKLYLVIQEMLGIRTNQDSPQREDQEEQSSNLLGEGVDRFRHTLRSPNCVKVTSYAIDIFILATTVLKGVCLFEGTESVIETNRLKQWQSDVFYTCCIIQ